jgi:hypothetical protein
VWLKCTYKTSYVTPNIIYSMEYSLRPCLQAISLTPMCDTTITSWMPVRCYSRFLPATYIMHMNIYAHKKTSYDRIVKSLRLHLAWMYFPKLYYLDVIGHDVMDVVFGLICLVLLASVLKFPFSSWNPVRLMTPHTQSGHYHVWAAVAQGEQAMVVSPSHFPPLLAPSSSMNSACASAPPILPHLSALMGVALD